MIVGIDLGTTYSLIAAWQSERSELIKNRFGSVLTPSVIALDETGNTLVGCPAYGYPNSIANFKRYMGTGKTFVLGRETFRPEELSALILKALIQDAETYLNMRITEAVITVPAYFNDTQRKATRLAGELAGLKIERLINEPTAAALAYGLHQRDLETKFLIFDLGGGTFDVSIVELFSGIMEVRSSAGDNHLGGEDFSNVLEEIIKARLLKEFKVDLSKFDHKTTFQLHQAIHCLKHDLSSRSEALFSFQLEDQKIALNMTREAFNLQVEPLVNRFRGPLEQALGDARIQPHQLDAVILVGGATRMPLVQEEIGKMLGIFPQFIVHPDEAVALGAGIQAALKQRHADLDDVVVTDVCPFSLGTSVVQKQSKGSRFLPIIERNTTIPTSRTETLCTIKHHQSSMLIDVYQGESYKVEENVKIGELRIAIPPAPAGEEAVEIRYSYDVNGLLEVEATVLSTGKQKCLLVNNQDHQLGEAEIATSLEKLKQLKIHPRDLPENHLLLVKLERLFQFYRGEERDLIADVLGCFNHALDTQETAAIDVAKGNVEEFLSQFEDK